MIVTRCNQRKFHRFVRISIRAGVVDSSADCPQLDTCVRDSTGDRVGIQARLHLTAAGIPTSAGPFPDLGSLAT